jgi:hypothetical protein
VLLSGSNNNVTFNYLSNNRQGLFFGFEQINGSALNIPADIIINQNSFVQNEMQLSGCVCEVYNFSEVPHAWITMDEATTGVTITAPTQTATA